MKFIRRDCKNAYASTSFCRVFYQTRLDTVPRPRSRIRLAPLTFQPKPIPPDLSLAKEEEKEVEEEEEKEKADKSEKMPNCPRISETVQRKNFTRDDTDRPFRRHLLPADAAHATQCLLKDRLTIDM